ncbi:MAG: HAD hydrolase-like protein [Woeseiaceae bacterium]
MKIETIIFDLDGTISDPFEGISKSVNFALESLNYGAVDPERIRPLIGPPLSDIFKILVGEISSTAIDALVDKYRERYSAVGYTENVIYPEIPALISTLSNTGFRLGICTSKRGDYATAIVDMFGLLAHFEFVDGGAGVHKSLQIERLIVGGLDARTTIMIGDRHFDINAAKHNDMKSIGVTWGFAGDNELQDAAPDHIVDSPEELLDLFQ